VNCFAAALQAVGDMEWVRIVQMLVFVASGPDFGLQSRVPNAASEIAHRSVGWERAARPYSDGHDGGDVRDPLMRVPHFRHNLDVRSHVKKQVCGNRTTPGQSGAVGITAGNVGEAAVFAAAGFNDIFIAYPIWAAGTKGPRIRKLAETTRLRVEVDCGARPSGAAPEDAGALALAAWLRLLWRVASIASARRWPVNSQCAPRRKSKPNVNALL
jgi:hypothetical protein